LWDDVKSCSCLFLNNLSLQKKRIPQYMGENCRDGYLGFLKVDWPDYLA